jgi:hypothetical protein
MRRLIVKVATFMGTERPNVLRQDYRKVERFNRQRRTHLRIAYAPVRHYLPSFWSESNVIHSNWRGQHDDADISAEVARQAMMDMRRRDGGMACSDRDLMKIRNDISHRVKTAHRGLLMHVNLETA